MAKKKEKRKLTVSEGNGKSIPDTPLYWEDLEAAYNETARSLIGQMTLLVELMKLYELKLAKKPELMLTAQGLQLSYSDIATDLLNVAKGHAGIIDGMVSDFRKGLVSSDDDSYFDYIRIGGEYIVLSEKIAHLTSTVYLDLLTQLNVDAEAGQIISDLKKELNGGN